MKLFLALSLALLFVPGASGARTSADRAMPVPSAASLAASRVLTLGVVRKVDKTSGSIIVQHGAVTNLGMPAATTSFAVAEKKFLEQVKAGEKVRFHVERVNDAPTLTYIRRRR